MRGRPLTRLWALWKSGGCVASEKTSPERHRLRHSGFFPLRHRGRGSRHSYEQSPRVRRDSARLHGPGVAVRDPPSAWRVRLSGHDGRRVRAGVDADHLRRGWCSPAAATSRAIGGVPWTDQVNGGCGRCSAWASGTRPPPTTSAPLVSHSPSWRGPPCAGCRRSSSPWLQRADLLSCDGPTSYGASMTGVLAAALLVIAVPQDTEPRVLLRLEDEWA